MRHLRVRQAVAVLAAVLALSPIWAYMAYSAWAGGEEYVLFRNGFHNWRVVARQVTASTRTYIRRNGRLPFSVADARAGGVFNVRPDSPSADVPHSYSPSAWRVASPLRGVYCPPDALFAYEIRASADSLGNALYVRRDGGVTRVRNGSWRPIFWWDVCLPWGPLGFLVFHPKIT